MYRATSVRSHAETPIALVPISVSGPQGLDPINPRLALVGDPVREIGEPLFAVSNIDVDGYTLDPLHPKRTKAEHWSGSLKPAVAMGLVFGGLIGLLVGLISRDSEIALLVGGVTIAVILAFFIVAFAPERKGWTAVVGADGAQIGMVNRSHLERALLLYTIDHDAWFEQGVNTVLKKNYGMDLPMTPMHTRVVFTVRDRASLATRAEMAFVWTPKDRETRDLKKLSRADRLVVERATVLWTLQEQGYPRRIQSALERLRRGEAVELPMLDQRRICLIAAPGSAGAPCTVEIRRGASVELRVDQPIALKEGVYTFAGGGTVKRIPRQEIGDAFVLDALCLPDR